MELSIFFGYGVAAYSAPVFVRVFVGRNQILAVRRGVPSAVESRCC